MDHPITALIEGLSAEICVEVPEGAKRLDHFPLAARGAEQRAATG